MTLELHLRNSPVALAPGVATRVPVELHNRAVAPATVRVAVARGRASAWAVVEPAEVTVEPGATAAVDVVLHPPADQPPSTSMVPFTVHAEDATTGEPAGFATGLLTVAVPIPVSGEVAARAGGRHTYDLRLVNDGDRPAPVRVEVTLDPPAGTVAAEPAAVQLEPRGTGTVVIRARPQRPVLGRPRPYFVVVAVRDAHDPDRAPMVKTTASGTRRPRLPNWAAATAAIVLAVAATAAVALSGVRLPLPGSRRATPPPAAAAGTTPAAAPVTRPYALIEVFPHRGEDGGRAAAEAARARLAGAGMPVRLVDSRESEVLAEQGTGFWVLLQDGFTTPEAAQAFCTQWTPVAPKCRVTL